mgnify:CR=1 FL=1
MINVTKTYLPNIEKYNHYIETIYKNGWVTNYGPLVKLLEKRLAKYLGVKNLVLVSNGTAALEVAYRVLNVTNDVITSPFSFVATTSSLVANKLNPIFVDINSKSLNINSKNIEKYITNKTSAIVPVHVYGNACEIDEIQYIANKYNLKVIYDAAHAFGVNYKNQSILNYGDISTLSFHATKIFHTIEGGAVIINNDDLVNDIRLSINFGIENKESIVSVGTNTKINEFQAAMGLCVLDDMKKLDTSRERIYNIYMSEIKSIVSFPDQNINSSRNFSYFPILLESEKILKGLQLKLENNNIFTRRYFYPSLDTLKYINPKQICPISRDVSSRVLCLPMYPQLSDEDVYSITKIIKKFL